MVLPRTHASALASQQLQQQLQQRFVTLWLSFGASFIPPHIAWTQICRSTGLPTLQICHRSVQHRQFIRSHVTTTSSTKKPELSPSKLNTVPNTILPAPEAISTYTTTTKTTTTTTTSSKKKPRKRTKLEWTPEIDTLLLEMRTVQDKKWSEIGIALGREPATCMNRFESTLNPALENFWTFDRDKRLDAMITSSKSWPEIAQALGCHRLACMERWRQLNLKDELASIQASSHQSAINASTTREKSIVRPLLQPAVTNRGAGQEHLEEVDQHQRQQATTAPSQQREINVEGEQEKLKSLRDMVIKNLSLLGPTDKGYDDDNDDRRSWNLLLKDDQRYDHYRSWKKRSKMDAFSQLYLTNPGWSAKEETVLIQFVLRYGLDKWDIVAEKDLKNRFTAAQCRTCWKNLDMPVVSSMQDGTTAQLEQEQQRDSSYSSGSAEPAKMSSTRSIPSMVRPPPFVWDKELSVRLQTLIRQAYKSRAIHLDEINWQWVSRRVHPNATSRICRNHWKFLHDTSNQVVWRQEDIRKLEEGVRLLGPKRLTQIRDHFLPYMAKDDIMRHWYKISDKTMTIDENEYYRLLAAVQDMTDNDKDTSGTIATTTSISHASLPDTMNKVEDNIDLWTEIEKKMGPGWKRLPCKRVWESSFQHLVRTAEWSPIEDNMLLQLVKLIGRDDWYSIAKVMQTGKSPWQYRLRWCQLVDPVDLDKHDLFVRTEKYC